MAEFASNGKANAALTTGIIGTAGVGAALLNGGLNGLFGGWRNGNCGCNEDHVVDRYEAGQAARIAQLETEVKLRDANTYTDQKMLEMYKYFDSRTRALEASDAAQAVTNQRIETVDYIRHTAQVRTDCRINSAYYKQADKNAYPKRDDIARHTAEAYADYLHDRRNIYNHRHDAEYRRRSSQPRHGVGRVLFHRSAVTVRFTVRLICLVAVLQRHAGPYLPRFRCRCSMGIVSRRQGLLCRTCCISCSNPITLSSAQ